MAELAPNLYVSPYVTPVGTCYVLDLDRIGAGSGKALAVSDDDWATLDPAKREELLDTLTRESAEAGQRQLEQFLAHPEEQG